MLRRELRNSNETQFAFDSRNYETPLDQCDTDDPATDEFLSVFIFTGNDDRERGSKRKGGMEGKQIFNAVEAAAR